MDTKMMRRAGAIGVGLLLAGSLGTAAQEPVGGYTWEPFEPVGAEDELIISGIAAGEGGRLAVFGEVLRGGKDPAVVTVWTSEDGGGSWTESTTLNEPEYDMLSDYHERHEDEARFAATVHDDLFVFAFSVPGGTKRTYILTSPDGVHWRIAAKLKNVRAEKLISTPDGLAMLGLDFRKAKGFGKKLAGYPTLWLSDDAADWEASEISAPLYKPKDDGRQEFDRIARADDGTWMASGLITNPRKGTARPSIWTADPGLEWSEVAAPDLGDYPQTGMSLIEPTPAGFLFAGQGGDPEAGDSESGLWLWSDGTDWEQVLDTGAAPPIVVAARTGAGYVAWKPAFGGPPDWAALPGSPTYVSSNGRSWQHDPETDMAQDIHVGSATSTPEGVLVITGNTDLGVCEGKDLWCVFGFGGDWDPVTPVVLIGTPE